MSAPALLIQTSMWSNFAIAAAQDIPLRFLENILAEMRQQAMAAKRVEVAVTRLT